jgi:large subunit ribosomal protein L22
LIGDELVVAAAYVDEGPTIKRWRARARGRVARIKKHTCHVTIRLVPSELDTPTRRPRQQRQAEAPAATEEQPQAEETKPKRAPRTRKAPTPKAEATDKPKRTPRKKKTESEES